MKSKKQTLESNYKKSTEHLNFYHITICLLILMVIGISIVIEILNNNIYFEYVLVNPKIIYYVVGSISFLSIFIYVFILVAFVKKKTISKIGKFLFKAFIPTVLSIALVIIIVNLFSNYSYEDYHLNPNITIFTCSSIFAYITYSIFASIKKYSFWKPKITEDILDDVDDSTLRQLNLLKKINAQIGVFALMKSNDMHNFYYKNNFNVKRIIWKSPYFLVGLILLLIGTMLTLLLQEIHLTDNSDLSLRMTYIIITVASLYLWIFFAIWGSHIIPFYFLTLIDSEFPLRFIQSYLSSENIHFLKYKNKTLKDSVNFIEYSFISKKKLEIKTLNESAYDSIEEAIFNKTFKEFSKHDFVKEKNNFIFKYNHDSDIFRIIIAITLVTFSKVKNNIGG